VSAPAPAPIALEGVLARRLGVAGRLLRTLADARLSGLGLGAPALGVLMVLGEDDGLTQAELSRRQRVEAPSMCRMVDRLARDGLVERRPDAADRRVARVGITAAGRDVAARGAAVAEALERDVFGGLDPDERELLADLLGRVLDRLPRAGGPAA
jgi:MarR family transcriptional regulator for hemolysin